MNTRTVLLGAVAALTVPTFVSAANIDRSTITEVVNSVSVIEPASKRTSPAKVQQLFVAPNVLRTGPNSRAEMIAPDQTVTRVGQSTLFSFEPNSREIELQRGSILFQSPTGKGGGTIRTSAASAAVLGTTLIVTTTNNGGFKVLVVEGKGRVRAGRTVRTLRSGQMVYALPGGALSRAFEFRLGQQVGASNLLNGFKRGLPSAAKIQAAIARQEKEIAQGKATATNLLASSTPNFAFRVDVARETLVQGALTEPQDPVSAAASTDAIIDAPALEQGRVFGSETTFGSPVLAGASAEAGVPVRAANPTIFLANNILFDTPTVSLSPYANSDAFQFLAQGNIDFTQSVDFGFFNGQELQLVAGNTITAAPNTLLTANTPNLLLAAFGSTLPNGSELAVEDFSPNTPLELADFGVRNTGGNVFVAAGEMALERVALESSGTLNMRSSRDLAVRGGSGDVETAPDAPESNAPAGFSRLTANGAIRVAAERDVTIERTAIRAPRVQVHSGAVLKLTAVQINDGSTPRTFNGSDGQVAFIPPSDTPGVHLFAKDLADIRRANFFANDVLIQSNTIALQDVRFRGGSRVLLESRIGTLASNPNTGQPIQPGHVNFVRGVTYGGAPAEEAVIQNGPAPTPSGPGIIVRPYRGRN